MGYFTLTNKANKIGYFDINNTFCTEYLKHMKDEKLYNILRPVIEYVVLGIWFDTFKTYVTKNPKINISSLQVIDKEIKQYVLNYGKNIFFIEQAKHDVLKKAFLLNSYNSKEAIAILESFKYS